ncbi:MAG: hypothetical protein KAQ65_00570 [Candidatus Thorarchaeota archaeon]|nr:hypothetical protein [Candidatus Thorarchaeota archaeon]
MSQRPKKKKGTTIPLNEFKFDPSDLDLKLTRSLITVFDGYQIYRCFDLTFMDKRMSKGEVPRGFIKQWPTVKGVLHKFAAVGPKVQNVETYLRNRQIIAFLALALLTISAPLLVVGWILRIEWIVAINIPLALIAVFSVFTSAITNAWFNRKVAWAVFEYTEGDPSLNRKEKEFLHEWTQGLIYHAARIMRKEDIDYKKKRTKFYNDDYKGVEVLQVPKGLRKHYTMHILTERVR